MYSSILGNRFVEKKGPHFSQVIKQADRGPWGSSGFLLESLLLRFAGSGLLNLRYKKKIAAKCLFKLNLVYAFLTKIAHVSKNYFIKMSNILLDV